MVVWNKATALSLIKFYKLKFKLMDHKIENIIFFNKREQERLEKDNKDLLKRLGKNSELYSMHYESMSDDLYILTNISHDNMAMTIVHQAILIEKFLVDLSKQESHIHNEIIPVTWNTKGNFTDCIQAMRYILKLELGNANLNQINYWEQIKLLRDLRQRFAHGAFQFKLTPNIFNNYNNKFKNRPLLKKVRDIDHKYLCCLVDDVTILKVLNDYYLLFIDNLENQFFT